MPWKGLLVLSFLRAINYALTIGGSTVADRFGRPFRANCQEPHPGLKPWATLLDHFMVKNQPHYSTPPTPFENQDSDSTELAEVLPDEVSGLQAPNLSR